jgi:hypothetical protein
MFIITFILQISFPKPQISWKILIIESSTIASFFYVVFLYFVTVPLSYFYLLFYPVFPYYPYHYHQENPLSSSRPSCIFPI